jgi:hypothetical protein
MAVRRALVHPDAHDRASAPARQVARHACASVRAAWTQACTSVAQLAPHVSVWPGVTINVAIPKPRIPAINVLIVDSSLLRVDFTDRPILACDGPRDLRVCAREVQRACPRERRCRGLALRRTCDTRQLVT